MKLFSLTLFIFNFLFFRVVLPSAGSEIIHVSFFVLPSFGRIPDRSWDVHVFHRAWVPDFWSRRALFHNIIFSCSFFDIVFSAGLVHVGIRRNPLGACWLHMELTRSSAIFVAECLASREIERIILFLQLPLQIVVRGLDLSVVW